MQNCLPEYFAGAFPCCFFYPQFQRLFSKSFLEFALFSTSQLRFQDQDSNCSQNNLEFSVSTIQFRHLTLPKSRRFQPQPNNDGRDAFLVMSSAYYDRTCLKSAVDFEQKNYFCLSRSSYSCGCARKFT